MNENILIVDDDITIRNLIEIYLKNEGYSVHKAENGEEAINKVKENQYDLVILDIMMPKVDGIEACLKIREEYNMPIIFLSAKDSEIDKIQGLTVGADDYISKPFSSMELLARVKAQLRRYTKLNYSNHNRNILRLGDLEIDTELHQVKVKEIVIKLTPKEFSILELLVRNKGIVFSIEKIYETVWNENFVVSDTAVLVHITNIRQKIEENPKNPQYIKTVWGVGYKA